MSDHIIRGNRLTFKAQFTPSDGSVVVPSEAYLTLVYKDRSGGLQTDNVALQNIAGVWTGSWDTSNVGSGQRVEWMSWCEGLLQAAVQGSFHIDANKANDAV